MHRLETLERIGGDFIIESNSALIDLNGLFMLKEIGGKLEIIDNTVLKTLFNTTSLKFLGLGPKADLIIKSNSAVRIVSNDMLENTDGLRNLEECGDKIDINSNKMLRSINLENLGSDKHMISIRANPELRRLDGIN